MISPQGDVTGNLMVAIKLRKHIFLFITGSFPIINQEAREFAIAVRIA